jgi:hypothetical protein
VICSSVEGRYCNAANREVKWEVNPTEEKLCVRAASTSVALEKIAAQVQAALLLVAARACSQLTETSLETPGSCMVTPYRAEAISIVRRL